MRRWLRRLFGLDSEREAVPIPAVVLAPVQPSLAAEGSLAHDSGADRRRWPRVQLELEVRLRFASTDAMVGCRTFDISPGGAFIVLENPRREGTRVRLSIFVGDRTLILGGVVVRTARDPDEPNGMAIHFTEVSADDEAFIVALGER